MELILVRHGLPARVKLDPPLSEQGREHARLAARGVVPDTPDVVISSHLARARQTAEPTATALGLPILEVEGVAEVDGEGAEYIFVEDIRAEGGDAWKAFLANPVEAMGGDETHFRQRTLDGFNSILRDHADAKRVAVFTHGFPINVILAHTLGIDAITRFSPAHGSITRLGGSRMDRLRVLSFNETSHLREGST